MEFAVIMNGLYIRLALTIKVGPQFSLGLDLAITHSLFLKACFLLNDGLVSVYRRLYALDVS